MRKYVFLAVGAAFLATGVAHANKPEFLFRYPKNIKVNAPPRNKPDYMDFGYDVFTKFEPKTTYESKSIAFTGYLPSELPKLKLVKQTQGLNYETFSYRICSTSSQCDDNSESNWIPINGEDVLSPQPNTYLNLKLVTGAGYNEFTRISVEWYDEYKKVWTSLSNSVGRFEIWTRYLQDYPTAFSFGTVFAQPTYLSPVVQAQQLDPATMRIQVNGGGAVSYKICTTASECQVDGGWTSASTSPGFVWKKDEYLRFKVDLSDGQISTNVDVRYTSKRDNVEKLLTTFSVVKI